MVKFTFNVRVSVLCGNKNIFVHNCTIKTQLATNKISATIFVVLGLFYMIYIGKNAILS